MVGGWRVSRWVVFGGLSVVVGVVLGDSGVVVILVRLVGIFVARRGDVVRRDGALVFRTALVCVAGGARVGGIDVVWGAEVPVGDGIVVWMVFGRSGGVR